MLWTILALNVLVAVAKLVWGLVSGSIAMQADGFHSLFDGTGNVVGLIGMAIATRPADRDHPYGHRKFETYASSAIAVLLALAAYRVGSTAIAQFSGDPKAPTVDAISFAVMLGTMAANLFITTWERREGKRLGSEVLLADAAHTASDVLVSGGVIVSLILVKLGYPQADPFVALLVAGAIVFTAVGIMRQAGATLADTARIDPEEIRAVVTGVRGVLGCHHIRTRGAESAVYVDLHVQVDETRTVADGHGIAEEVERAIGDQFPQVVDVIAHLEPFDEYQMGKTRAEEDTSGG